MKGMVLPEADSHRTVLAHYVRVGIEAAVHHTARTRAVVGERHTQLHLVEAGSLGGVVDSHLRSSRQTC